MDPKTLNYTIQNDEKRTNLNLRSPSCLSSILFSFFINCSTNWRMRIGNLWGIFWVRLNPNNRDYKYLPIHVSCRISDACLNLLVVFHDHVLLELFIAQHCGYCRPPLRSVFVCCPCLVCVFTWEIGKSFCHDFKLIRIFSDLLFGGLWGPMRLRSVENSSNR